jgi:hypothetical protein
VALSLPVGVTAWAAELSVPGHTPNTNAATMNDDARMVMAKRAADRHQARLPRVKAHRRIERERAAKRAEEARERRAASRSADRTPSYSGDPRTIAADMAASKYGWNSSEFSCLDALWSRESGWDSSAQNASSGAYGIPQALPGSKMATFGSDWASNPATQIAWGLDYIANSYGSPCGAWATWQSKGWY